MQVMFLLHSFIKCLKFHLIPFNFTFSLKDFLEQEQNEAMKKLAEKSLEKLENRILITDEFIAASILDPGQVNSSLIKSLQASPLSLLKTLWEKYKLDDTDSSTQPLSIHNQSLSPTSSQAELNEVRNG